MRRIALLMIVLPLVSGCTDAPNAERVLREQGYSAIKVTGYAAWMCSDKDTYATAFEAKSPAGIQVSGAVCSGWLKGNTIRFK